MAMVERIKIADFKDNSSSVSFCEEGVEYVRQIPGPVAFVCCAGSNAPDGIDFLLGTHGSCQGLKSTSMYIFTQPLLILETGAIFLIHSPGLLSRTVHDPPTPPCAMTLALVISSSILFFGTDASDCNEFGILEETIPMIQIRPGEESDWGTVAGQLPPLLWAVPQQAITEGSRSGKKFLEAALTCQEGFSEDMIEANRCRQLTTESFKRREAAVVPTDPNDRTMMDRLRQRVAEVAEAKMIKAAACTGATLACLIESYASQLTDTKKACTGLAQEAAVSVQLELALDEAILHFRTQLKQSIDSSRDSDREMEISNEEDESESPKSPIHRLTLPAEALQLEETLLSCMAEAELCFVQKGSAFGEAPNLRSLLEKLRKKLDRGANTIRGKNHNASRELCEKVLSETHAAFMTQQDEVCAWDKEDGGEEPLEMGQGAGMNGIEERQKGPNDADRQAELWMQAYKSGLLLFLSDYKLKAKGPAKWEVMGEHLTREGLRYVVDKGAEFLDRQRKARDHFQRISGKLKKEITLIEGQVENAEAQNQMIGSRLESEMAAIVRKAETERQNLLSELALMEGENVKVVAKIDRFLVRQAASLEERKGEITFQNEECLNIQGKIRRGQEELREAALLLSNSGERAQIQSGKAQLAALMREKELLKNHLKLLSEHVDLSKAMLEAKASEIGQVEYQWAETKAKVAAMKDDKSREIQQRDELRELVRLLKDNVLKNDEIPPEIIDDLSPKEQRIILNI